MNTETNIIPINADSNVVKYEANNIKNLIYYVRGKQVIFENFCLLLYDKTTISKLSLRLNFSII